MKVGRMATPTPMVPVLVSGCRVLHHTTSFDPVLYNRYVHMRALERTGGNEHWWALRELLVIDGELLVVLVVPT